MRAMGAFRPTIARPSHAKEPRGLDAKRRNSDPFFFPRARHAFVPGLSSRRPPAAAPRSSSVSPPYRWRATARPRSRGAAPVCFRPLKLPLGSARCRLGGPRALAGAEPQRPGRCTASGARSALRRGRERTTELPPFRPYFHGAWSRQDFGGGDLDGNSASVRAFWIGPVAIFCFPQRAAAAFFAISARLVGSIMANPLGTLARPPRLPSETAARSFFRSDISAKTSMP